jgi:hypothetical protein
MKKDIHDDHLDDYVRKSFDDYEEDPQDNMWDRIENALVEPEKSRRPLFFWVNRWNIAASFVIFSLLAGLAYGHYYYEGKIQELSNVQPSKGLPNIQPAPSIEQNPEGQITQIVPQSPAAALENVLKNSTENSTAPVTSTVISGAKSPVFEPKQIQNSSFVANANLISNHTAQEIPPAELPVSGKDTTTIRQRPESNWTQAPVSSSLAALVQLPNAAPQFLPTNSPTATLNRLNIPIIEPHKSPSGWYIGIQTTRFQLKERGIPDDSSDNNGIGHHLVSRQQKVTSRSEVGLNVGKKLSRNFGVETGLSYRSFTRMTAHSPRFRFGEGVLHPYTPGSNRNFDFSYNLNTYGGETAVTLRMEEVDNSTPALPDEPLVLRIITSEHTELIRMPLLFTAQYQLGPVALVAKTGLVGNMITDSRLTIINRVVAPGRFQPAAGTGAYSLKQAHQNRFFLGYQCNAGVEIKLGQHLAGTLNMGLSGDFDRKQNGNQKIPGLVTTGITAGLSYYF